MILVGLFNNISRDALMPDNYVAFRFKMRPQEALSSGGLATF
jgi:hypothetical protein